MSHSKEIPIEPQQSPTERLQQGADYLSQWKWIVIGSLPFLYGMARQLADKPISDEAMNATVIPLLFSLAAISYKGFRLKDIETTETAMAEIENTNKIE